MGCVPLHMGLCLGEVPAVQSLSHASGVPAPFDKGAFGCTTDTGRVREVTNYKKPPWALTAAARRRLPCERELAKIFDFCLRDYSRQFPTCKSPM